MIIRRKNFNKLVEQKVKEKLENDSYICEQVRRRTEYKIEVLNIEHKKLEEAMDFYTKITEFVEPNYIKARTLVIEYTPTTDIDKTMTLIFNKIQYEVVKQYRKD